MMNTKNDILFQKTISLFNKYSELEKVPREYAKGIKLFPSAIHTLEAIGKNPNLKVTQLADFLGVKKATISRGLKKLEKQGLILRYKSNSNQKEIFFKLTDKGQRAFDGHEKFHHDFFVEANEFYNELPTEDKKTIEIFLDKSKELLENHF